jgi:hypothetical protein
MSRLDNTGLTKLVGRLLEIKCPMTRYISFYGDLDGKIAPHYYFVQMQTQMYITKMTECDFLQCKITEYDSWDDYIADAIDQFPGLSASSGLEKGCLIQLAPREFAAGDKIKCKFGSQYIYPPKLHMTPSEIQEWITESVMSFPSNRYYDSHLIDKIIYWKFDRVACHLATYNKQWFESKIPLLQQFWDYVLFYRSYNDEFESMLKYIQTIDKTNSKKIFEYINQQYIKAYPKSTYKPLYQKETEWRKTYNEKYAKYK